MKDTSNYLKFIRPLLIAAGIIIPLLGYLDILRGSVFNDPIELRIIISLYCFGVVLGSYFSDLVKKNIVILQNGIVFIGIIWFNYIAYLNDFHNRYNYGLFILIFICSFTFSNKRTLLLYLTISTLATFIALNFSSIDPDEAYLVMPKVGLILVTLYFVNAYMIRKRTELDKAEIDLKEVKDKLERLAAVAEETDNLIILTGENEKIEWVNKAFEKSTGYQLSEIRGLEPTKIIFNSDTPQQSIDLINEAIKNKTSVTIEKRKNLKTNFKKYLLTLNGVTEN